MHNIKEKDLDEILAHRTNMVDPEKPTEWHLYAPQLKYLEKGHKRGVAKEKA